jgi:hypothetical protein
VNRRLRVQRILGAVCCQPKASTAADDAANRVGLQPEVQMNIDKLRDYNEWIGKTPDEILIAVRAAGGWASVFSSALPVFAHQVRNFFNVEPFTLQRYPSDAADELVGHVQARFKNWGTVDKIKGVVALSGDVYKDESNKTWYQMSPGATIYHWGGEPTWAIVDAYSSNYVRKQDGIPIFKLVSPDGTGGSLETVIRNNGKFTIGAVNRPEPVAGLIVETYRHQGSYNYSETVEVGLSAHEIHDVEPHKKYPTYYLNPLNRFSALRSRQFPARNAEGKQIGYEKGMEPFEFDTTRPDSPTGNLTLTDPLADLMAKRYPPNHPGSLERVKGLETLFHKTGKPKRLLARIEARNDKAVQDFHAILHPDTVRRLVKILRDRHPGGPSDVGI